MRLRDPLHYLFTSFPTSLFCGHRCIMIFVVSHCFHACFFLSGLFFYCCCWHFTWKGPWSYLLALCGGTLFLGCNELGSLQVVVLLPIEHAWKNLDSKCFFFKSCDGGFFVEWICGFLRFLCWDIFNQESSKILNKNRGFISMYVNLLGFGKLKKAS